MKISFACGSINTYFYLIGSCWRSFSISYQLSFSFSSSNIRKTTNHREREVWKSKNALQSSSSAGFGQQQHHQHVEKNQGEDYNEKYDEDEDTDKPAVVETSKSNSDGSKITTTKTPQTETDQNESEQLQQALSQQQQMSSNALLQQQQNPLASNPMEPLAKPWFFKNGEYYPKPAKIPKKRRGKKAHLQGSKLFPYQDPHSDRIINQLMYVPPNYEEIKSSGKLKTILLYNGLGPWNVKAGKNRLYIEVREWVVVIESMY